MIINFNNIGGSGSINSGAVQEQIDQSIVVLVASADYISSAHTINFYNESGTTLSTIDATDFIKDGMVNNVYVSGSNLVITFNTDSGKEDIEIPLTSIFPADNYYTKTDIDNKGYLTSADTTDFLTSADTQNFATTLEVVVLEKELEDAEYTTSVALNDLNTRVNAVSASTANALSSGDVETQILSHNYLTSADTQSFATITEMSALTAHIETSELVISTAINDLNDRVNAILAQLNS